MTLAQKFAEAAEMRVVRAQPGARIGFFNQWRDETHGTTMYRLNDAAMRVEQLGDDTVILNCSDGIGTLNFEDLVLQMLFRTAP